MKWICPKCSVSNDETSGICPSCYTVKPVNPPAIDVVASPVDLVVAGSPIPSGAGFGIRFLARFLDLLITLGLGLVVGGVTGVVFSLLARFGKLTPEWPVLVNRFSIAGIPLGILAGVLYHAIGEGVGSVSVGKLICGLRVVQLDGRPVKMRAAVLRSLAYYVDSLFFGLIGYNSMEKSVLRQRYGDVWAKTVVVKRKEFTPIDPRSGLRITLGVGAGLLVLGWFVAFDLVLKVI